MLREDLHLSEKYREYFPVGVAVRLDNVNRYREILKHYNSITMEDELKFCNVHPQEDVYSFEASKEILKFAMANNMSVRGHTLIWHEQVPDWVFSSEKLSRDVLLKRMEEHISIVVDQFKNSIFIWDVVNEPFDDGAQLLRNTKWYEIIGEDYIERAFFYAHEANPKAKLFLNEYNCEIPEKRDKLFSYVEGLKRKGVPIHGIGVQGHYSIFFPSVEMVRDMLLKYAKLDLQIQITELDISVFQFQDERTDLKRPSKEMLDKQARMYSDLFSVFREFKDIITGVTFWGVADDHTWKDDFPVKGRKDWPLLFDENLRPKEAFNAIMNW